MLTFYLIGCILVFIIILLKGSYDLSKGETDIFSVVYTLIWFPFTSWLAILVLIIAFVIFIYTERKKQW